VSNKALGLALKEIRDAIGDSAVLITGKMHGAGVVRKVEAPLLTKKM
jgi:hypothetical protein